MQISKPTNCKSVSVGFRNLHFNTYPQIILIHTQIRESLDWAWWVNLSGLRTLQLYSTFCESVLCMFIEKMSFIKGVLDPEKARNSSYKKNEIVLIIF